MQKSVYSGQLAGPVYTRIRIVGHCGVCCCVQWSAKMTTVHSLEWIYVKDGGDFCLVGSGAGKYAGQLLKAGSAAQPKGCSACFVPATVRSMGLSWYIRLGIEKGSRSDFAYGAFCYV